ncbi:MAG: hypothetical protein LUI05_05845 [Oscillospiraceae bacterium]|nr:hypothetical protein [Oscillospiraceae bacterium]
MEVMTAEVESVEVYANDEEPKTSSTVKKSLTEILGEGNNAIYSVVTSNGLVSIKLNGILKSNSSTDTDMDGITDWEEVNVDLIEELHHSDSSTEKIRYTDLPTLGECLGKFSEYGYTYVLEGFNQIMSSEPMSIALKYSILPIISNPADPDGDNDGIPDFCDEIKLSKSNIYTLEKYKTSIFMVLEEFSDKSGKENYKTINNSTEIYPLPNVNIKELAYIYKCNLVEVIGIVETNYSYIEPRQINQNPDSKLEEGQEVCTYENMEVIPGNIYSIRWW